MDGDGELSRNDVGGRSGLRNVDQNITGNGHTVTYDATASANAYLKGATYTLAGGGTLAPAS